MLKGLFSNAVRPLQEMNNIATERMYFNLFYANTLNLKSSVPHTLCSKSFYTLNKLHLLRYSFLFKKFRSTQVGEKHSQNGVLQEYSPFASRGFQPAFHSKCEVGVQDTDIFVDRQWLSIGSFTWFNLIHNPSITKQEHSRVSLISSNQGQSIIFLHGETNPRYSRLSSILELLATGSLHQPLCRLQETYILVTEVNVTTSTKENITRI